MPAEVEETWLTQLEATIGELPLQRQARMQSDYGLSPADAATILHDKSTADLFEAAAGAGHATTLSKQFVGFWSARANERKCSIAQLGVDADRLGELSKITADGTVNATAAAAVAEKMLQCPDTPTAIAEKEGLVQVRDETQMQAWVDQAFAANQKAVTDALDNPKKQKQARGFLTGQVMKVSGGQADPKIVGQLIGKKLAEMSDYSN